MLKTFLLFLAKRIFSILPPLRSKSEDPPQMTSRCILSAKKLSLTQLMFERFFRGAKLHDGLQSPIGMSVVLDRIVSFGTFRSVRITLFPMSALTLLLCYISLVIESREKPAFGAEPSSWSTDETPGLARKPSRKGKGNPGKATRTSTLVRAFKHSRARDTHSLWLTIERDAIL